jgi:DNA-binding winged helix-turn-helix (wHTH) protein
MDSVSAIRTGELVVDPVTHIASVDDRPLRLTGKEYAILELLSARKGTTLTKEMFLNHLYGGIDEPELKIIDVFVCKLRKKLALATGGKHYIETVWGRGYVLRDPVPVAAPDEIRRVDRTTNSRHTFSPVEMRFGDAVTTDGGPLHLPRPDPERSLFGCQTARCHE